MTSSLSHEPIVSDPQETPPMPCECAIDSRLNLAMLDAFAVAPAWEVDAWLLIRIPGVEVFVVVVASILELYYSQSLAFTCLLSKNKITLVVSDSQRAQLSNMVPVGSGQCNLCEKSGQPSGMKMANPLRPAFVEEGYFLLPSYCAYAKEGQLRTARYRAAMRRRRRTTVLHAHFHATSAHARAVHPLPTRFACPLPARISSH